MERTQANESRKPVMKRFASALLLGLLPALISCGGGATGGAAVKLKPEDASGRKTGTGHEVSKEAAAGFDTALESFLDHDKKGDWSEASCKSIAEQFTKAAETQTSATNRAFPEALYNAGLAYQRCGKDSDARTAFEGAAKADSSFHRAKAQLVLYEYSKTGDMDSTIRDLDQIIRDAKFQNVEALVSLAALQMERGSDQPDSDGKNDLERAQRNLQRALAIDDGYMPAFNQLANYYLELAKTAVGTAKQRSRRGKRGMEVSGATRAEANEQQLDLAALVASQAQRKNPNYAPIHNTTGLIQVELKNFNAAVKSFGRARQLDPKFYEAQMNYAAVNLSFRGFEEAEKAYRDALKQRPNDYEAHLGLALALRGQINDSNFDKNVAEAQKHLDEAKKLDGTRPETYYNEAILTQEYRSKRGNPVPMLEKAAGQYSAFVEKAGDDPVFAQAVKRSKDRTQDINDTIKFIKEGEIAKKQEEAAMAEAKKLEAEQAKQKAEEEKAKAEEAKKKAEEDKKKAEEEKKAKDAAAKGAAPGAPAAGKPADPKAAPPSSAAPKAAAPPASAAPKAPAAPAAPKAPAAPAAPKAPPAKK
jgi:Flp pilus assembly protein TadD